MLGQGVDNCCCSNSLQACEKETSVFLFQRSVPRHVLYRLILWTILNVSKHVNMWSVTWTAVYIRVDISFPNCIISYLYCLLWLFRLKVADPGFLWIIRNQSNLIWKSHTFTPSGFKFVDDGWYKFALFNVNNLNLEGVYCTVFIRLNIWYHDPTKHAFYGRESRGWCKRLKVLQLHLLILSDSAPNFSVKWFCDWNWFSLIFCDKFLELE
jgi:hypothetical protein